MNGFVDKYFWLFMIAVALINWAVLRSDAQVYMNAMPDKKRVYNTVLWGILGILLIPWIIMGMGCTIGGIPDIWHYFKPQDGNYFVLIFHTTIAVILISATIWIFLFKGAALLASLGVLSVYFFSFRRIEIRSPFIIKTLCLLQFIGYGYFEYLTWYTDVFTMEIR